MGTAAAVLPPPLPCAVLTLAAVNPIYEALKGPADYFASLNLPEPLVHWGGCNGKNIFGCTTRTRPSCAAAA